MKKRILLSMIIVLGNMISGYGQSDIPYSQLVNNPGLINPASQGLQNDITADLLYALPLSGLKDAPHSFGFNLHGGINAYRITAGLIGQFDKYVISTRSLIAINLSAGIQFTPHTHLLLGIRFGTDQLNYDREHIEMQSENNFNIKNENNSIYGAGLTFQYRNLQLGTSFLFRTKNGMCMYINGEYDVPLSPSVNIRPVFLYRHDSYWNSYTETGCFGGLPEWFQIGICYRTTHSVIFTGQVNVLEYAQVTYSYLCHTGILQKLVHQGHEISLHLNISRAIRKRS